MTKFKNDKIGLGYAYSTVLVGIADTMLCNIAWRKCTVRLSLRESEDIRHDSSILDAPACGGG